MIAVKNPQPTTHKELPFLEKISATSESVSNSALAALAFPFPFSTTAFRGDPTAGGDPPLPLLPGTFLSGAIVLAVPVLALLNPPPRSRPATSMMGGAGPNELVEPASVVDAFFF